jgi:hypothetical protein
MKTCILHISINTHGAYGRRPLLSWCLLHMNWIFDIIWSLEMTMMNLTRDSVLLKSSMWHGNSIVLRCIGSWCSSVHCMIEIRILVNRHINSTKDLVHDEPIDILKIDYHSSFECKDNPRSIWITTRYSSHFNIE